MKPASNRFFQRQPASHLTRTALAACGPLSACVMIAADRFGAMLTPGYSSTAQAISELVEVGAAQKSMVDPLLVTFHGLAIPFAAGLFLALTPGRNVLLASLLLAGAGLMGVVLTLFLPCDPGCRPFVSLRGTLHIAIAVPMGFAILFAILLYGRAFQRRRRWQALGTYSVLTAAVSLVLAAATVLNAETPWVGTLERALTLGYIQWYAIVGSIVMAQSFVSGFPDRKD